MEIKKILADLLSVATLATSLPIAKVEVNSDILNVFSVHAETATSGKCGDNVFWSLSDDGVLTFSGTGEMKNYIGDSGKASLLSPFKNNNNIKSVIIKDGITSIGSDLLLGCSNLTSVIIPNSVEKIGIWAFSKTKWLEDRQKENPFVIINDILIDGRACTGDVTIPDTVKKINDNAFYYNKNITSVIIPDTIGIIGRWAFGYCSSLENVTIPDSVTSIEYSAFSKCDNLAYVEIPDSITSIDGSVFSWCNNLTDVEIPSSVTLINDYAFFKCSNFANIYYTGTKKQWENININRGNDTIGNTSIYFESKMFLGDLNKDKKIDSKDAVLVLRSYAESLAGNKINVSIKLGDVNYDAKLDSKDAVIILRYYAAKLANIYDGNIKDFK